MPPSLALDPRSWAGDARARFAAFADGATPLIASHDDADGLSSAALLARAWDAHRGARPEIRLVGRGENAWDDAFAAELAERDPPALVVADLGLAGRRPAPGAPMAVIDHHVPTGVPDDATVISGYGLAPTPSTSLLAWHAAGALGDVAALDWLAAVGLVGDYGDTADFPLIAAAKKRHGAGLLRETVSLVNAPRRSASGDADAALALLLKARDPKDAVRGGHSETTACDAAREEVKAATAEGRRQPPRFGRRYGRAVAVIRLHSPCQIHPLVAQSWTGRLKAKDAPGVIVFAANFGFREGMVAFAGRASGEADIVDVLARHRPDGADPTRYGNGHRRAAGGTLPHAQWNALMEDLGFGPELRA
ncbi:hypothetical protein [uncultured Jannaschia sp.]|uniref:hypothetical protein n=1 Tax=uncultured Jannaschia sp. TaxID=293347 RepID=UPI00261A871A|nr:hypothetical protein [uncultured Jannaschia sp.]